MSEPARSATSAARYAAGSVVDGKYRLTRLTGKGAMGAVWVATNVRLEAEIAIKLFDAERLPAGGTGRVLREARAAAQLDHPGIVRAYDFGQTESGDPFIVMEYLRGEDLAKMLRREGPLTPIHAGRLLLPIAEALAYAHEKGVVHRDLKPANVFVAKSGDATRLRPKLVDFGLAKHRGPIDADAATLEGSLLGSPHYMSPEQVMATPADHRSDIWAFCVILYQAVAGRPPFLRASEYELLGAILHDDVPAYAAPPSFKNIVARGLEKDPAKRWSSMQELGRALARWLFDQGVKDDVTSTALRTTWLAEAEAQHRLPPSIRPGAPARSPARASEDEDEAVEEIDPAADVLTLDRPPASSREGASRSQYPTALVVPGARPPDAARLRALAPPPPTPPTPLEPTPSTTTAIALADDRPEGLPRRGGPLRWIAGTTAVAAALALAFGFALSHDHAQAAQPAATVSPTSATPQAFAPVAIDPTPAPAETDAPAATANDAIAVTSATTRPAATASAVATTAGMTRPTTAAPAASTSGKPHRRRPEDLGF